MVLFETTKSLPWFAFQCLFKLHLKFKIGAFLRTLRKFPYLWFWKEIPLWAQRIWCGFAVMLLSYWQVLRCEGTEHVQGWTHYLPSTDLLLFYSEHLPAKSLSLQASEIFSLSPPPISPRSCQFKSEMSRRPTSLLPPPAFFCLASSDEALPSCPSLLVFPPCASSLKCGSDHCFPHFTSLAGYPPPIEGKIETTPPTPSQFMVLRLFTVWLQFNFLITLDRSPFSELTMSMSSVNASTHPPQRGS